MEKSVALKKELRCCFLSSASINKEIQATSAGLPMKPQAKRMHFLKAKTARPIKFTLVSINLHHHKQSVLF